MATLGKKMKEIFEGTERAVRKMGSLYDENRAGILKKVEQTGNAIEMAVVFARLVADASHTKKTAKDHIRDIFMHVKGEAVKAYRGEPEPRNSMLDGPR